MPWARHRALCPAPAPPQASVSTTDLHRKAQILPLGSSYGPGSLAQKPCGPGFPAPRDSLLPQSPPQVGYLILPSRSPPGDPAPTKHLSCAAFPGGERRNAGRDLEAGPGSSKPGGGARLSRKPISTREVPAGAARVRRGAESPGCPGHTKCSCFRMRWQMGVSAGGQGKVAARE